MASPGILVPNAHLIGLLLQMLATGAFPVPYLCQCPDRDVYAYAPMP